LLEGAKVDLRTGQGIAHALATGQVDVTKMSMRAPAAWSMRSRPSGWS
jgi:uncharacterized membrane protein YcjF (UPF0283 family)